MLLVHRLVDHACDFHVTAEGKPSYAVLGVAPCGTLFAVRVGFCCFFLGLVFEQREPRVEKQIEFFDLDAEHSGEYVVAKLMDDYQ